MKLKQNHTVVAALSGALFIGLAGISNTALGASATGTATATIVTPIGITAGANLQFGNMLSSAVAGTATVAATSSATAVYGSGVSAAGTGGTSNAGTFSITGSTGVAYTLTVPASVTLNSGANSMTATLNGSIANGTNTLSASPTTLYVGGVLSVGANQAAGSYSGTYSVTVTYN